MFLIIPHLFLFRKTQSKEFTNSLKTKSQHCDLPAPDDGETESVHGQAAGPGPAPPRQEEEISVSLRVCEHSEFITGGIKVLRPLR